MKIEKTAINDVLKLTPTTFSDHRGTFTKLFGHPALHQILSCRTIRQINRSVTLKRGTVRGLHFQNPPKAEMKVITCLQGKVLDIALDIRYGSATFLKWAAVELSPLNQNMIVIPEGFAHGFQALEDNSELLYFCTADYDPRSESGINVNDPTINIPWPHPPEELSEKDNRIEFIQHDFLGIKV